MINIKKFDELLAKVSYYNAAEGSEYFRETAQREAAIQELKDFMAQYTTEEINDALLELLQGNDYMTGEI